MVSYSISQNTRQEYPLALPLILAYFIDTSIAYIGGSIGCIRVHLSQLTLEIEFDMYIFRTYCNCCHSSRVCHTVTIVGENELDLPYETTRIYYL